MNNIISIINSMARPNEGFNILELEDQIWGVGSNGEIIFGIDTNGSKSQSLIQSTKYLKLYINHEFICINNGLKQQRNFSLYVLKDCDKKTQEIFIGLCLSMGKNLNDDQMIKNFFNLKDLFANQSKPSQLELQGLFGELFTIYYLMTNVGLDISPYYQNNEKMKFDFSIDQRKKIEVKTTLKPERTHHFLHQQLDTDKYDIRIVSLKLQKDDHGMSLLELIDLCKEKCSDYFFMILYIEMMIKNIDDYDLDVIRFNEEYTKKNFKIYNANDVPKMTEKNVNGVFNVEYDVDLENVKTTAYFELIDWISKKD